MDEDISVSRTGKAENVKAERSPEPDGDRLPEECGEEGRGRAGGRAWEGCELSQSPPAPLISL